ncbi:hypothetical protein ACFL1H_04590 [Nanoarchaeota archaeon]
MNKYAIGLLLGIGISSYTYAEEAKNEKFDVNSLECIQPPDFENLKFTDYYKKEMDKKIENIKKDQDFITILPDKGVCYTIPKHIEKIYFDRMFDYEFYPEEKKYTEIYEKIEKDNYSREKMRKGTRMDKENEEICDFIEDCNEKYINTFLISQSMQKVLEIGFNDAKNLECNGIVPTIYRTQYLVNNKEKLILLSYYGFIFLKDKELE